MSFLSRKQRDQLRAYTADINNVGISNSTSDINENSKIDRNLEKKFRNVNICESKYQVMTEDDSTHVVIQSELEELIRTTDKSQIKCITKLD